MKKGKSKEIRPNVRYEKQDIITETGSTLFYNQYTVSDFDVHI